jgi:sensor histidine kinase YesM
MKFLKFTFFLFFLNLFCYSQNCLDSIPKPINTELNTTTALKILKTTAYHNVRDFNKSKPIIDKVFKFSKQNSFLTGIGRSHLAYANFYYEKGNFVKSLEQCLKAVSILEKTEDFYGLTGAKICIAKLERENKNFKKAITILLELSNELKQDKPTSQLANIYLNTGNVYMNLNSFDKAKVYLNKAKEVYLKLNCETGVAMVNVKFGRYYKILFLKKKNRTYFNKTIEVTNKALKVFKKYKQYNNQAYTFYTQATVNSIAGHHKESISIYKKALANYEKIKNLIFSMRIKQHLFVAYSILDDSKKALKANAEYLVLKDSIFNLEKRKLIADAHIKFETEKIRNEKLLVEIESKKNRNLFLGAIIITGLIILTTLFYFSRLKTKKKAELITLRLKQTQKRLAIEKQYRDSELKALKAQMNPHFIFNALNSIQDYIVLNQKNLASDYLGKFADLIRNYLHFSDTGFISISDEVHNLNLYLELEKLRFEEQLEYTFKVGSSVNSDVITIPTMLIQPYVENALKHGLLHKKENRKLQIAINKVSGKIIECIIDDNGVGREKSKEINSRRKSNHKSFALKATTERLDLLNYGKKNKIGVIIIDLHEGNKATGTRVILKIPILKK